MRQLNCGGSDIDDVELVRERLDDYTRVIEVAGQQALAQRRASDLEPPGAEVGDRRDRRNLDLLLRCGFHGTEQAVLARFGERDGGSAAPGASGPADAVDVRFGGGRHIVVDDVRQPFDVEAARRDVGGDEEVGLTFPKATHHAVAQTLLHAAMERLGAVAVRVEHLDEGIDLEPCAAEHERRVGVLGLEDAFERCRLVRPRHDVGNLADPRELSRGQRLARDRQARRILQMTLGNRQNPRRHRRREERRLASSGRGLEDGVQILGEAHVQHLVRLVQDEHVEPIQFERAAPDVVERAAGRRDHDVGAALERANLLEHRGATVEREDREPAAARVFVNGFGDLHGQFARRDED